MTFWLIEPQDPLIVRDGRPFNATPGARATSLPFPFPSTIAGGVRSRAGEDVNGVFDRAKIEDVKQIKVRGPLLVELDGDSINFLVPAPADAAVFGAKKALTRQRLCPLAPAAGADNDNQHGLPFLVGLPQSVDQKPAKEAPAFWSWERFKEWLINPANDVTPLSLAKLGHDGPQPDRRIHVGIDPGSFTGLDGALFLTSGLTFWHQDKKNDDSTISPSLAQVKKLALAVTVDGLDNLPITEGYAHLGGERRLMSWRQPTGLELPVIPDGLADKIIDNGGYCRVILLTPTYFTAGWRPGHFGNSVGATVTLQAALVDKPDVVSGWDFEHRGPKSTRRLAPAGSVYFVKVEGDIRQWLKERWLQPLSDDQELAAAGFGLTAVGFWDGTAEPIQINVQEEHHG